MRVVFAKYDRLDALDNVLCRALYWGWMQIWDRWASLESIYQSECSPENLTYITALLQDQYESLKLVDTQTEYMVHGFVHQIEHQHTLSNNIPLEIIKLCLLFFFNTEYFEGSSYCIEISGEQKDTITKDHNGHDNVNNIAYGSNWIPSTSECIYKWTIEIINNHSNNNGIVIGIIGKIPSDVNHKCFAEDKLGNFIPCYANWGGWLSHNGEGVFDGDGGIEFGKPGQTVTLELDVKKGQLVHHMDGKLYGPAFKNIIQNESIKYKFAVSLFWLSNL